MTLRDSAVTSAICSAVMGDEPIVGRAADGAEEAGAAGGPLPYSRSSGRAVLLRACQHITAYVPYFTQLWQYQKQYFANYALQLLLTLPPVLLATDSIEPCTALLAAISEAGGTIHVGCRAWLSSNILLVYDIHLQCYSQLEQLVISLERP